MRARCSVGGMRQSRGQRTATVSELEGRLRGPKGSRHLCVVRNEFFERRFRARRFNYTPRLPNAPLLVQDEHARAMNMHMMRSGDFLRREGPERDAGGNTRDFGSLSPLE